MVPHQNSSKWIKGMLDMTWHIAINSLSDEHWVCKYADQPLTSFKINVGKIIYPPYLTKNKSLKIKF